ncbi:MAG TPA: DUF3488 and transglutaminase-like domain-containing protein [Pyrinomonadaceae bacterium]|nr:DUF3488 and transglutaminase-like domain-containing protein [Pyrinomonadaceae bacterium]
MTFETLFKSLSYLVVLCGFLAMWVSGTFGLFGSALFIVVMITAWNLEDTRWQVSERLGTVLIVAALPAYYLAWRFGFFGFSGSGAMVAGVLGRLILSLTAIKLLQRKSDRDWIFLYLMAFFEVLLAAGMSISALYLLTFVIFVFMMVCTIIVFEIRKTGRSIAEIVNPGKPLTANQETASLPAGRLPLTATLLIICIILFALPLFFLLPRVGGAGLGGNQNGVGTSTGFSDVVRLGGIGDILQNDQVVMRVRVEESGDRSTTMKWRGVALDTFDNRSWSRTRAAAKEPRFKGERDIVLLDTLSSREELTVQTVYLEPLDTPVLFALPRAVGVQGNFPVLFKDRHDSITFNRVGERISYKVLSDRSLPAPIRLRFDRADYDANIYNYLQLPDDLDPRIAELAATLTANSRNRYDAANVVENHLQNGYGYTLEQKASGSQPLADFLFNVREGHCEYFATAMAIMLRTQGIATRVVNGFSQGEYNETADVWVVRQRNAHSWVEVYFPGEDVWVPYDPTPFSGQLPANTPAGLAASVGKYLEALETFWIQYFVAFDNQEQRSLFTSVRRGFADYQSKTSSWMNRISDKAADWWSEVRGDKGLNASLAASGIGILYLAAAVVSALLLYFLIRFAARSRFWQRLRGGAIRSREAEIVEFYERMIRSLAEKGFVRKEYETPLEFASALGSSEVYCLTRRYNRVRFGDSELSNDEALEIEGWLKQIAMMPADPGRKQ